MILYGDSEQILKAIGDNSVDLIATDPPYMLTNRIPDFPVCLDCGCNSHGAFQKQRNNDTCPSCGSDNISRARKEAGGGFMGKSWDAALPTQEIWTECYRVLKPGAFILVMASPRNDDLVSVALREAGINNECERLCDIWKYRNQIGCYSLPIRYNETEGFYIRQNHPTVKPVSLFREIIKLFMGCNERPIILDPFAGSGTTHVAAILSDCACVSIDAEAEYIEIIKARVKYWKTPGVKEAYLTEGEIKEINNDLPLFND